MNSKLQQQLKQDGKTIQQQAQKRLDQWDVSSSVSQALEANQANSTRLNSMWYGLAATVTLTAMLWTFNSSDFISVNQPALNQQIASKPIELNLKKLPLTLEQKINQPLLDEQQAIIQDLKILQAQLLSI